MRFAMTNHKQDGRGTKDMSGAESAGGARTNVKEDIMTKNRIFALLLSLALAFTYMPALAFAEDDDAAADSEEFVTEELAEDEAVEERALPADEDPFAEEAEDAEEAADEADPADEAVEVTATEDEDASAFKGGEISALEVGDHYGDGTLIYEWMSDGTAMLYWFNRGNTAISTITSVTIPGYAVIDGVSRMVASIDDEALCGYDQYLANLKSVTVPSTVTSIGDYALGYRYDDNDNIVKVSGFTIFGTTGSAAQRYAASNGFTFRDPVAEAEAARQGTYDKKIPKVKISKPKGGKKTITVKWKKLTKKQLKKSKAKKYEIWACANKGFASGQTSQHEVKKSKSAIKITHVPTKGTYYVKVRAIKYVGGVKYVGKWSKVKKVKVK